LFKGRNILVAEDNVLNQKIVSHTLIKNGATVTIAINGTEVIKEMSNRNFDLILMDLYMPEMDGFEATEYIRDTLKNPVPIIALSASNFEEEMKKCINTGMNACIVKPFDIVKLQNTLNESALLKHLIDQ
jgi:CheY-like chemotaxis protein